LDFEWEGSFPKKQSRCKIRKKLDEVIKPNAPTQFQNLLAQNLFSEEKNDE
jgi:hypothetical protein